ncbi:MAG: hypothetical protein K0U54_13240, partial [Bacteroidetes bacterium]|nr:hypothetical protein [Bacteroidota bacterium]
NKNNFICHIENRALWFRICEVFIMTRFLISGYGIKSVKLDDGSLIDPKEPLAPYCQMTTYQE